MSVVVVTWGWFVFNVPSSLLEVVIGNGHDGGDFDGVGNAAGEGCVDDRDGFKGDGMCCAV